MWCTRPTETPYATLRFFGALSVCPRVMPGTQSSFAITLWQTWRAGSTTEG